MFSEPQATPYDVRFQLFGFPVRVAPWFWIVAILISGGGGAATGILVFVLATFLSILIHELGHAWAFRHFGISSHIVLYHFGGLAVPDGYGQSWGRQGLGAWQSAIVSAAGPVAQIAAAILVVMAVALSGHGMRSLGIFDRLIPVPDGDPFSSVALCSFVDAFCYVSLYWAVLNLIPVYPLDGGQITRNVLIAGGAGNPIPMSLMISVVAAGAMCLYGIQQKQLILCFLFFSLGMSSYQALNQTGGGFGTRSW